ncbi:MAG: glutamine-hydrolyzing carbamoyl-phosphate synthase small subunit [Bacteroidota bacterium]
MKYTQKLNAVVLLSDGTVFNAKSVSNVQGTAFGEICFNTGMTGYQEIFTDPSYFGQLMVTTNAHIGNYGINKDESESDAAKIAGLVCKNFSYNPSRVAMDESLEDFLKRHQLIAVSDVDTRALVEHIRVNGAMNAVISTRVDELDQLKIELDQQPSMKGLALCSNVSTKEAYTIPAENEAYKIAVLDLGVKHNILRNFSKRNCTMKVFPWDTSYEEMMQWAPDALFLSNGPGDPEPLTNVVDVAQKSLADNFPTFGICLGHQIISQAMGIPTFKMHHGHRGINHPVKNLLTGKAEITSQNHGFAIDKKTAEEHKDIEITHLHLNDHSVAGMRIKNKKCMCVQYHPEAGPGPNDATYLFDEFLKMLN